MSVSSVFASDAADGLGAFVDDDGLGGLLDGDSSGQHGPAYPRVDLLQAVYSQQLAVDLQWRPDESHVAFHQRLSGRLQSSLAVDWRLVFDGSVAGWVNSAVGEDPGGGASFDGSLHEAYLEWRASERALVWLGARRLAWGKSQQSPLDRVDARDHRFGPYEPHGTSRQAALSVGISLWLGDAELTLAWVPYVVGDRYSVATGDWAFAAGAEADVRTQGDRLSTEPSTFGDGAAARLTTSLGGVDLELIAARLPDRVPILSATGGRARQRLQHSLGLGASWAVASTVLSVDLAWVDTQVTYQRDGQVVTPSGLESALEVRWDPAVFWSLTMALTSRELFDVSSALYRDTASRHAVEVNTELLLAPSGSLRLVGSVSIELSSTHVRGHTYLSWQASEATQLRLGMALFAGGGRQSLGGLYGHNDYAYLRGRTTF